MGEGLTSLILLGLIWYVVFLLSTTLHEAAHAWSARMLGDPTAYHGGQVTLNPLPHILREPIGMVLVPLISSVSSGGRWMFGWASAPYDPLWARRYPKRAALMALAGPAANLLLIAIAAGLIHLGIALDVFAIPVRTQWPYIVNGVQGEPTPLSALPSILFLMNLVLFFFNLLPIPPLDGAGGLQLFLPEEKAIRWQEFCRQPVVSLVGILVAWFVFNRLFDTIFVLALNVLYPGHGFGVLP